MCSQRVKSASLLAGKSLGSARRRSSPHVDAVVLVWRFSRRASSSPCSSANVRGLASTTAWLREILPEQTFFAVRIVHHPAFRIQDHGGARAQRVCGPLGVPSWLGLPLRAKLAHALLMFRAVRARLSQAGSPGTCSNLNGISDAWADPDRYGTPARAGEGESYANRYIYTGPALSAALRSASVMASTRIHCAVVMAMKSSAGEAPGRLRRYATGRAVCVRPARLGPRRARRFNRL